MSNQFEEQFNSLIENSLIDSLNISREEARKQVAQIQNNAAEAVENSEEFRKRLDLLQDIPQEELESELLEFTKTVADKNLSEQERVEMINDVFSIIGLEVQKKQNGQSQIQMTEPKI